MKTRFTPAFSPADGGEGEAALRQRGFTLLELTVVIVLIAIVTAVIVPEMRGTFEDALLRSQGRKLLSGLSLAYSQAVTTSQRHRLRLDRANNRYLVERAASETDGAAGFVAVRDLPGGEGSLDQRITIRFRRSASDAGEAPAGETLEPALADDERAGGPDESISFYPDGTADAGELRLRDREGFELALRINPITARVTLAAVKRE